MLCVLFILMTASLIKEMWTDQVLSILLVDCDDTTLCSTFFTCQLNVDVSDILKVAQSLQLLNTSSAYSIK